MIALRIAATIAALGFALSAATSYARAAKDQYGLQGVVALCGLGILLVAIWARP